MDRRLNDYLDRKDARSLDEGVLKAYTESMKERTIPDTEKQVKKNEERAAALRFSPRPAAGRKRKQV